MSFLRTAFGFPSDESPVIGDAATLGHPDALDAAEYAAGEGDSFGDDRAYLDPVETIMEGQAARGRGAAGNDEGTGDQQLQEPLSLVGLALFLGGR
ncbi:MAG: hypothetical protein H6855_04925 [Rhodospirillales bacterium]|nr:hypothetical protein [Rhodospirillales bacterium]MCB9965406.1 hypothetical protein [Rhodospirillales bacterium]MCB9973302.1 hypothetical protein [Rhodospirillales bacterium]MCB9973964.1 hypothetical protein [Rhodospirillales bacterium]